MQGQQANLTFITTATGLYETCHIYHHLEQSGSPILVTETKHFALLGFGATAQPVKVNTATLLDVEDKQVPGAAYFRNIDTTEAFAAPL
eukprot:5584989-Ditylum_brightwellii.AAC.1